MTVSPTPRSLSLHLPLLCLFIGLSMKVHSADRIKLNNTNNLNLGTSWTAGAVTSTGDVGLWDSTVTSANTVLLGANLDWAGIRITNPTGLVTIAPGNTLTLASAGIDMSSNDLRDLHIRSGLTLRIATGQIWNVAAGRTLTLDTGLFTRTRGSTLNVQGAGTVMATTISNNTGGQIIGPWATFGTGASTFFATMNLGQIVGYTGGSTATNATNVSDTTGAIHYTVAGPGALPINTSVNTLRYTGGSGTISEALTTNGVLTSGSGALTLSGDLTIGADRELVLTNGDSSSARNLIITGVIRDHGTGVSALTKAGLGSLTLSGPNTYTGLTTLSRGTTTITHNSALGSTGGGTRIGLGGSLTLNGGTDLAEPLWIDDITNANATATKINNNNTNTLSGPVRVASNIRWQSGGTLNLTGGIMTTAGAAGSTLVMQAANLMNITGKPLLNGAGTLYMDNGGRTIVLGALGNTYNTTSLYAGTLQGGVANAFSSTGLIQFTTSYSTGPAILDLGGFDQRVGGINTNTYFVSGAIERIVTSLAPATLTLNQTANTTFDGRITGAASLIKTNIGTLMLSGPSTTTGSFTSNGGTLHLNAGRATASTVGAGFVTDYLPATAPLTLGGGAFQLTGRNNGTATSFLSASWATASSTITVNSTAGLAPGQRLSGGSGLPADAYVVSILNSNVFIINQNTSAAQASFAGLTATANSFATSQSFNGLVLNPGSSRVTVTTPVGGSDGTVLNLGAITRDPGATLEFVLPTGTQSASNGITTDTTNQNGILGAWARIGNDWATQSTGLPDGNLAVYAGYTDLTRLSSGVKTVVSSPTSNLRIVEGTGSPGDLTPAAPAGTTDINTFLQNASGEATYNPGTADLLRLGENGGILLSSTAGTFNVGTVANDGLLTAGGADDTDGILYLTNLHLSSLLNIRSTITDNGTGVVGVTTSGPGTVVLSGSNSHTGRTVVGGSGRLRILNEGNLGVNPDLFSADQLTLAGGTLNTGASFAIDDSRRGITLAPATGNAIQVDSGTTLSLSIPLSGTGDLTVSGAGTLALNVANTHQGVTRQVQNVGTLALGHVNALQNSTLDTAASGSQTLTFTVLGTQTYHVGGLQGGDAIALGTNSLSVGANHETTTYTGSFSDSGGLTKVGNGTLNLTNASTHTGDTRVTGGHLVLANANALQNSTLDTGPAGTQSVILTMPEATVYQIGGLKGTADFDLAVSHLSVGSNQQNTTFDGRILGAFNNNLTKVGDGILTLNGDNTYIGTTTISDGTLLVNGTSGRGDTLVLSGATLGGTGSLAGDTTIQSGGFLTGGTDGGVGTLTFQQDLTADNSVWLVDLVEGTVDGADRIDVSQGVLSLTGATLDLSFTGTFTPDQVFTIANYSSLVGTFNGLADGAFISDYQIHYGSGTNGAITLTAVPEPGTLGLLSLAVAGFFRSRFRRRRSAAILAESGDRD